MNLDNTFDRWFAGKLALLVESGLIDYRDYYCWADAVIMALDDPPLWVLDLAVTRNLEKAAAVAREFVASAPAGENAPEFDDDGDYLIAGLLVRHELGTLSWPQCLMKAGALANGYGGKNQCEEFYWHLNIFEKHPTPTLEAEQYEEIAHRYRIEMEWMRRSYKEFLNELPEASPA